MDVQNNPNQNYDSNQNYAPNQNQNQNQNAPRQMPPKTWLVESILATLFCCLPFGIVGIVQASKVESAFYAGNVEMAQRASAEAKKWTMISFWLGLAGILVYLLLMMFGVFAGVAGFMDAY